MHDLRFNSSRLYSNEEHIENYCFPLFTDFITGYRALSCMITSPDTTQSKPDRTTVHPDARPTY